MSYQPSRTPDIPASGFADNESAREHGRDLAIDLLLTQLYRNESVEIKPITRISIRTISAIAASIAILLFGGLSIRSWFATEQQYTGVNPPGKTGEQPDETAMLPPPGASAPGRAWKVQPSPSAEFELTAPFEVQLESGELLVPPSRKGDLVTIDTEDVSLSAEGAEFRVEAIASADNQPISSNKIIVEILSGEVTIETPNGTIIGKANDRFIIEDGKIIERKE